MSGLCGILPTHHDRGRDVAALDRGLSAIAHRGGDGLSCYHDEHILIGHALFDTGCNGFALDDDGFVIAFDGRLDNGDVLRAKLRAADGLHSLTLDNLSDTRLILAAYRAFGYELAAMLVGDFAIAIWDPVKRQVYLARDHFGVKPLFYRKVFGNLLFASEIKALLAVYPEASATRRDAAMSAFVEGDFGDGDADRTFFDDIYRFLPGHFAIATTQGFETHCYSRLDPDLPSRKEDVGAEFRTLFFQAVGRRLRGHSRVAAFLSGGLDSSSIVSALASSDGAAISNLPAYSLIFSEPEIADEREYIGAVVEQYRLDHKAIDGSAASGLADADVMLVEQDQPPFAPNGGVFRHFLKQVVEEFDGKIILHGHGGDEVVSDGAGLFGELAADGHWFRLWKELNAVSHVAGIPGPNFRRLVWRRGIRRSIGKILRLPYRLLRRNDAGARDTVVVAPDGRERPTEQVSHLRKLTSPVFAQALEIVDIEAACAGVELRMPFLDLDLVRFCVTVESSEKWKGGMPRSLIRTAMQGILPEKVRLRIDKHDFSEHLRRSLLHRDREIIDDAILKRPDLILPFCNLAQIRADWSDLKATGELDNLSLMRLWRVVMLSRWLRIEGPTGDDAYLEAAE